MNQWCEVGVYLLASQAVDKCQLPEGAETALQDIRKFLMTTSEDQLSSLKDLHEQYEVILTAEVNVGAFCSFHHVRTTHVQYICSFFG